MPRRDAGYAFDARCDGARAMLQEILFQSPVTRRRDDKIIFLTPLPLSQLRLSYARASPTQRRLASHYRCYSSYIEGRRLPSRLADARLLQKVAGYDARAGLTAGDAHIDSAAITLSAATTRAYARRAVTADDDLRAVN